jgi:ubiquinone/menaquinone biosynthesis C-methylase UbiE
VNDQKFVMESVMKQEEKAQRQFNQQAERFATWEVTGNEVNLGRFSGFCELRAEDTVLDVACGTGNMVIYCAPSVASVDGVDIAERMIALAEAEAQQRQVGNVRFSVGPVEQLPYPDGGHTLVMCRAAFHHFADPRRVFDEMLRCCRSGGRLSIQDIVAYGEPDIDAYVEELERAIDNSHCRTLRRDEFTDLFTQAGIGGVHGVEFHIRLDLVNYVGHAVQSNDMRRETDNLIERGLKDSRLSTVFQQHDGRLYLLRNVLFLGARKDDAMLALEGTRRPPRIVRLDLTGPAWDRVPEKGDGPANATT